MASDALKMDTGRAAHQTQSMASISLINCVVPASINRRFGSLPSLRRMWIGRSADSEEDGFPPPSYSETQTVTAAEITESLDIYDCLDRMLGARRPNSSVYPRASETSESNLRWKHVAEGCRLVERAGGQAVSDDEDPALTRKLYIDGVGYLLKAMPDLSAQETAQLVEHLPVSARVARLGPSETDRCLHEESRSDSLLQNNYVYRIVALATMYGVLAASFLLPLLERLATAVHTCDRRYQISTRVTATATRTVSSLARGAFASVNDGKAGQVALDMTLYMVKGASRGVLDGYGNAARHTHAVETRSARAEAR